MKPGLEVLLVEDHRMIREYVASDLRAKGYTVLEAETAVEAECFIDASVEDGQQRQPVHHIGAIVLDGRFPYGDDRDEKQETSPIGPAISLVRYALERGLGSAAFIGFSSSFMSAKDLGIDPEAGIFFKDVGKHSGGPTQILDVLDNIS